MVGLAVLGTAQTSSAASASSDAERARTLATTATSTVRVVHELDRELAETTALRQRGGKSGQQLVTAQRQRADAAAQSYRRDSAAAVRAAPALAAPISAASDRLNQLADARAGGSDTLYRSIAESLLAVADALPAQIADSELANAARTVAAVAAVEHFAALERDLLRTLFVRGTAEPGELITVAQIVGARTQREAEFLRVATDAQSSIYVSAMRGADVDNAARMSSGALGGTLKVDGDAWYIAQSNVIRRLNLVGLRLSDRLDDQASRVAVDAARRALGTAAGTIIIGLAALVTAIALAVRTARRLRQLRAAALIVARRDLPDAISSVITGTLPPEASSAAAVTRGIAASNDEIGEVAEAFATVHRTALRLAGEQAELRVDVGRMAEVLARRIRTLITRQLRLLDEFERDETDPDVLARLFALDHIAARLRRNGENLLVLAGGEPGRPVTQAVPLRAVITAAASEIEEFHRVEVGDSDVAIAGPVVGDVVHLLAELLENATTFSPPSNPVRVDARRTVDGAIVRVHDSGIGINTARLSEINARLAQPTVLTSAAAGTMGLYVVAHLAARHGVRVQLHATGLGTTAYVALPHRMLAEVADDIVMPEPRVAPWFRPYLSSGRAASSLPAWPTAPSRIPSAGDGGLPQRRPGEQLAPAPTPAPARAVTVDPEAVRARLSAFAEGVSAALRRSSALVSSAQKDR